MRSMQWQLGILGTISAFAYRQKETKKKNLFRGGRSQDLPNTDFQPAVRLTISKAKFEKSLVQKTFKFGDHKKYSKHSVQWGTISHNNSLQLLYTYRA